jgi:hypothetical protein
MYFMGIFLPAGMIRARLGSARYDTVENQGKAVGCDGSYDAR